MRTLDRFIICVAVLFTGCISGVNNNPNNNLSQPDNASFLASRNLIQQLLDDKKSNVVFYLEGDYCAICHKNKISRMLSVINGDSATYDKPVMIIHTDSIAENDPFLFKDFFSEECNVIITMDDSIRLLNTWMKKDILLYGFILDSDNNVKYSGFMYDEKFLDQTKIRR